MSELRDRINTAAFQGLHELVLTIDGHRVKVEGSWYGKIEKDKPVNIKVTCNGNSKWFEGFYLDEVHEAEKQIHAFIKEKTSSDYPDEPIRIGSREILTWNSNKDELVCNIFATVYNKSFGWLNCTVEVSYDFKEEAWFHVLKKATYIASTEGDYNHEYINSVNEPWKKSTAYTVFEECQEELQEELENIIH